MHNFAVEIGSEPTNRARTIKFGTRGRSAICKALSLTFVGISALGVGCHQYQITRLEEARSPDGHWLASASTIQNFGPGAASVDTTVDLRRTNVSERPMEVLGFSVGSLASQSGTLNLTMKWETPSHLDVTYNGHAATLYFQVVKYAGIEISVRDLSSATTTTSQ